MANNFKLAQAIFLLPIILLSLVSLVDFDEVEARHTEAPQVSDPGIDETLVVV